MKLFYGPLLLLALLVTSCNSTLSEQTSDVRQRENFGSDWQFQKGDTTAHWQSVRLPHTVNIEPLVVNDQWMGISWYKKKFDLGDGGSHKKHFLYFEGIMQEADIWVNGKKALNHKGGYLPFTVDITDLAHTDSNNEILIRVDNQDNSSIPPGKALEVLDFNMYGGIYRNAYLISTNNVYITDAVQANVPNGGGTLIHFENVSESAATGLAKVHVQNDSDKEKKVKAVITFSNENGNKKSFTSDEISLAPNSAESLQQPIRMEQPQLWSPETPNLYEVKVEIMAGNTVLDATTIRTGIKTVAITEQGFFLNGKQRFINGTNRHQEYPYVGYAISDNAHFRDAYKIKQAGFDFVRLSHYPHSEAFMAACDELGLMVMDCIPGWQYYEEGEFVENSYQTIRDMVHRDRNHPSVILWENSLNESGMRPAYMTRANEILREELPYEDTYTAGWIDHPSYDLYIPARQHRRAPVYWNNYDKGGRKILIAEYGDWEYYAHNAGFNQKEFENLKEVERTSRQLRADGEKRLLQQALNFQEAFNSNLIGENTIGHANWVMFDYNRGYSDDLESSGISDIFRIPKFAYYFYQSQKPPYQDEFTGPMVHIANYWESTSSTDVKVYSNAEEVALYLNGELIEKKKAVRNEFSDLLKYPPFDFKTGKFVPGTLKAIAYIDGEQVAEHEVSTPGNATNIELSYDVSGKPLQQGENDIVFVYAKIVDENGTLVHLANNTITFEMEGKGAELVGVNPVQAEAGFATILLKVNSAESPISIHAKSNGLEAETLTVLKN